MVGTWLGPTLWQKMVGEDIILLGVVTLFEFLSFLNLGKGRVGVLHVSLLVLNL